MGFGQAIATGFANYVNFSGRATRPAYWYFVLFLFIVSIITVAIDIAVFGVSKSSPSTEYSASPRSFPAWPY